MMLEHFDAAIADYKRALELHAGSPRVLYQLGAAYAAKHDSLHAFEFLSRAQASHRYDMTEISADLHLAGLRKDSRFTALLPKAADFEQPFVEPVKIIREWHGEAAGDQFGWIARNLGDVDGDGIADIVTSAPTHGDHAGRIYVYSVGSGRLLWSADGQPGDELGSGVEGIGDANGDGIPDVAASGPAGVGVAYIYSGRDGRILQSFKSTRTDELFGNHISAAGDVDGDGHADLIVGAPGKDGEYSNARPRLYLFRQGRQVALHALGRAARRCLWQHGRRFLEWQRTLSRGRRAACGAGPSWTCLCVWRFCRPAEVRHRRGCDGECARCDVRFYRRKQGYGTHNIFVSDWTNAAKGRSTGRIYLYSGLTGDVC